MPSEGIRVHLGFTNGLSVLHFAKSQRPYSLNLFCDRQNSFLSWQERGDICTALLEARPHFWPGKGARREGAYQGGHMALDQSFRVMSEV